MSGLEDNSEASGQIYEAVDVEHLPINDDKTPERVDDGLAALSKKVTSSISIEMQKTEGDQKKDLDNEADESKRMSVSVREEQKQFKVDVEGDGGDCDNNDELSHSSSEVGESSVAGNWIEEMDWGVNVSAPNPYIWDQEDRKAGFIYWVISLYKAKRTADEDFYLKNIQGELQPGQVCCILSPDEASTNFINLVSGRCSSGYCRGEVRIGGDAKTGPVMKAGTSYLLDGQVLADFVTVEECLMYTTYFVRPQSTSLKKRKRIVDDIMVELDLVNIRNTRIQGMCGRGISRAKRVAVNIGNMLLERKRILFMDRPAKGLDLIETEITVATILDVAKKRDLTVFLSMENPTKALLDNFTKLLMLANRQQLYFGLTENVGSFFKEIGYPLPEETSLYDHILDLTSDGGDEVQDSMSVREADEFLNSDVRDTLRKEIDVKLQTILDESRKKFEALQQEDLTPEEAVETLKEIERMSKMQDYLHVQGKVLTPHVIGWFFQVKTLINRKFKKIFRDPNAYCVEAVPLVIWLAVISWWFAFVGKKSSTDLTDDVIDLIENRDLMNMTSRGTVVALFISLFGVQNFALYGVWNAIKEVRLYKSEARSNLYSISAYMASWVFMSLCEQVVLIIPYSLCTFYFLGLYHTKSMFTSAVDIDFYIYYLSVLVLLATISTLIVYVFAFISNKALITLQCSVGAQLISTLFAGLVVPFPDTGEFFKRLSYVSPLKFAFEGLVLEYIHVSTVTNETLSIQSYYGTSSEPFVQDRITAWVALGVFVGVLFVVFVMVPSIQKCFM